MSNANLPEMAAKAREEAHVNLSIAAHYAQVAMGLLELGDDAGATYTLIRFRENATAALREFNKVRAINAAPPEVREAAE